MLQHSLSKLEKADVPTVLMYGSLLGFVRDHVVVMDHDFDADLVIFEADFSRAKRALQDITQYKVEVYDYPFYKKIVLEDVETKLNVDFFALHVGKRSVNRMIIRPYDTLVQGECRHNHPKEYMFPLNPVMLKGAYGLNAKTHLPNQPGPLLECWYGKQWRTSSHVCSEGFCKRVPHT